MVNNEHRANLKLDADNWVKLQNLAAIQNTSATKIINQLVDSYVNDKLPDDYQTRIEDKVFSLLDSKIDDALVSAIAHKVQEKLTSNVWLNNPKHTLDADSTDSTDVETNTDNTACIVGTDSTDSTVDTVDTGGTDNDKESNRRERNRAKFRHYKASDNKKGYSDTHVALQEGLSTSAVQRYRKGMRSPKTDFIERWGLNWNMVQWVKN